VDPAGYALAAFEGEGNAPKLEGEISRIIKEHHQRGTLNETPIQTRPPAIPGGPLRFPGKVATGPDGLLAISDSGHNRVVTSNARGDGDGADVLTVAGTGARGSQDGGFTTVEFTDPQGLLFLDARTLLVADTGNHSIRRLDLSNETVETVAGTGSQARWGASGGPARGTALNSPWDLELWDGTVVIAMAGPHQLWGLDLEKVDVSVLAGSGVESLADGPVQMAAMAQPSGLSSDGEKLWIVDSETSALRYLDRSGHLHTVVGTGLFDFGHKDGPADRGAPPPQDSSVGRSRTPSRSVSVHPKSKTERYPDTGKETCLQEHATLTSPPCLVERSSRFVMLVRVRGKDTESVVEALSNQIQQLPRTMMDTLT